MRGTTEVRTRPVLWPVGFTVPVGIGLTAGAVLVGVELLRRPEYLSVSRAFVASSGFGPVVLSLAMGSAVALPRMPTDVALGRDVYLQIAGVRPAALVARSMLLATSDGALAAAVCVLTAALAAWVVLPAGVLDPDVLPWTIANQVPALAELAIWFWMVGAAAVVVALVHLATAAGAGRVLAGVMAPLAPVLAAIAVPGRPGRVIEDMFGPTAWAPPRDPGWWSVLGGGLIWTVTALLVAAAAVLVTRRGEGRVR